MFMGNADVLCLLLNIPKPRLRLELRLVLLVPFRKPIVAILAEHLAIMTMLARPILLLAFLTAVSNSGATAASLRVWTIRKACSAVGARRDLRVQFGHNSAILCFVESMDRLGCHGSSANAAVAVTCTKDFCCDCFRQFCRIEYVVEERIAFKAEPFFALFTNVNTVLTKSAIAL